MSDLEIHRFTPDDDDDVRASFEISNAVAAADAPWEHPWLPDRFRLFLERGWDGEPPACYLARVDGTPVGDALVFTSERDNTHLAWLWLGILPEHRRRGYGTALFERLVEEVRALGRTSVGTDGWESERALGFAARHGLERKSQAIMRRQHLAELEPGRVRRLYDEAAAAATDYELVRITGRTPPELVDAMVELVSAINDAPTDDLDIEDEVFSPERLAAYEDAALASGNRLYRLVARHRGTGELGGHTVVAVEVQRPEIADQHDTAVAKAHRGHRLGLLLKAGMLLWLAEAEPQVATVDTWNAESNDHMIAVNEALGYRVMGRELQFQKSLVTGR
ncbi:GNAT family N-acetyltransferase [Nocardioides panacis]|uniref:GNAT family N-acetyltransferase n=1 Tax=Nocardioides panacis TaxID=2849501 RepID=A0A975T0T9_9ACTN|nr:GNAT family N-acetyltransferase [Nocardioides panacis]QWZ09535.1 GNAT family N-acetyltransferase [Nocardioides panacis]